MSEKIRERKKKIFLKLLFRLSQILKFVMIIYLLGVFTLMILDCISYARIRKADSIADSQNPSQFRIVSIVYFSTSILL